MRKYECPECGRTVGVMEVHSAETCLRQQQINRRNRGDAEVKCRWCGGENGIHKEGCPRSDRGESHG